MFPILPGSAEVLVKYGVKITCFNA